MTIADIKKTATEKMAKSVETLKHDLAKVRTGRAHTGLIDHLRVDYYGAEMPINQVANVTLSDARTITIQPFEKKMIQVVEKAIRDSDLGVNPATSGDVIRVPMPALTEERLSRNLSMSYAPEPDLFIRTGGEQRVSNFLLWQLAYTELFFTDALWPDFGADALEKAIASYRRRERRFGRTSEQLQEGEPVPQAG